MSSTKRQGSEAQSNRAPRLPAEKRKAQILDAAAAAFSAASFRDTSTADIAAAAGVSEPTLYRYFPSKRSLYLAMLDRNAAGLLGKWREIAALSPTPLEALRAIGRWYFDQVLADPQPYLLRARALVETGDEEVSAHARQQFDETFEFVQSIYERARVEGYIDADSDVRSYTWIFMSIGSLCDEALLMNMKLNVEELRRIMAIVGPVLLSPEVHREDRPNKGAG
jgi:TetR/AcrR family transcriptional regulator